jgi:hypothetical protein
MPRLSTVYDVLIASPSDVEMEREEAQKVISKWNIVHSKKESIILNPVLWETHSWPKLGDRPQAILNEQIVNNCDILIGFFWTRLGTPTGLVESGTLEEINEFSRAKKQVSLYFSTRPINPDLIDKEQYEKLKKYKQEWRKIGLVAEYETIEELKEKLLNDISRIVDDLQNRFGYFPRTGMSNKSEKSDIENIYKRLFIFLSRFKMELGNALRVRSRMKEDLTNTVPRILKYGEICHILDWAYSELWEIYGDMNDPEVRDYMKNVENAIQYITLANNEAKSKNELYSGMEYMYFDYEGKVKPHVEKFIDTLNDCLITLERKLKENPLD